MKTTQSKTSQATHASAGSKTKKFRVATSGATIDGREIKAEWLRQAAANYDPEIYAARINVEHLRGWGVNSEFGSFGDVSALHIEDLGQGKVALHADITLNQRGLAANASGQKVFTSIELVENFAGTGSAYLVGLALTDSPASLGTQRIEFSAQAADATYTAHTFSALGGKVGALAFGQCQPVDLAAANDSSDIKTMFERLRESMAARFKKGSESQAELAKQVSDTIASFSDTTAAQLSALHAQLHAVSAANASLAAEFNVLKTQLAAQPASGGRIPSTGGESRAHLTDY